MPFEPPAPPWDVTTDYTATPHNPSPLTPRPHACLIPHLTELASRMPFASNVTAGQWNDTQVAAYFERFPSARWADWCDAPCQELVLYNITHRLGVGSTLQHPLGTCARECFPLPREHEYGRCAAECIRHTGCCAANCYCGPFLGVYLALLLPVLVAPYLVKLACHWRPSVVKPPGSLGPLLLDALQQLGTLIIMVGVAPTIIEAVQDEHPWTGVSFPWRDDKHWRATSVKVHHFFAFVPLGITLVMLSQRPSLANVRSVVVVALVLMSWAVAAIVMFTVQYTSSKTVLYVPLALSCVHFLLLLLLLPIVCRGVLWRPTRRIAAWRLRYLWRVWRISMGVVGLWALITLIIITIEPDTPQLNGNTAGAMERLHLWGFLVQGVAFSVLPQHKWRVRFQVAVTGKRSTRHLSSRDDGPRRHKVVNALVKEILRVTSIDAVASPLAGWPEQPPGLRAQLVMHPRSTDGLEDGSGLSPEDGSGLSLLPSSPNALVVAGRMSEISAFELGRGGFSVVLRAQLEGGVTVAVKIATIQRAEAIDDANGIVMCRKEADVMLQASFHHPHLCGCIVLEQCSHSQSPCSSTTCSPSE